MKRFLTILVLLQQAAWLLVILPGHQRGAMAVAGTTINETATKGGSCVVEKRHSCCDTSASSPAGTGGKSSQSENPLKKLSHCAVCHIAVRLTPAPPPDFVPSPTGLVERLSPSGPGAIASIHIALPYDATGPPARL
ncbi:hypothetical protein [Humisphaera borealis]|uniref:DUF2946 domain-containing protein n=1 Tax=Humisphaera borealis TaxID=2807512 RepID=A0A7M2WTZ1_9BACT|nr:hypothetical protein [Humisphaera borealis]QOV88271.1 hypothetical protein IPV69_18710 [Humisphaera borealis]